jgi:hypothetical protein
MRRKAVLPEKETGVQEECSCIFAGFDDAPDQFNQSGHATQQKPYQGHPRGFKPMVKRYAQQQPSENGTGEHKSQIAVPANLPPGIPAASTFFLRLRHKASLAAGILEAKYDVGSKGE